MTDLAGPLRWSRLLPTLLVTVVGLGCQPQDESPGTWLQGESVARAVADWGFTDGVEEIFIETRPWYGIPHSTTIWCVSLDGALYVGSYGDEKKRWERIVADSPEARLQIEDALYEVELSPVTDPGLETRLDEAYRAKYDMNEVFGEDVPRWWYYQVTHATSSDPGQPG